MSMDAIRALFDQIKAEMDVKMTESSNSSSDSSDRDDEDKIERKQGLDTKPKPSD